MRVSYDFEYRFEYGAPPRIEKAALSTTANTIAGRH